MTIGMSTSRRSKADLPERRRQKECRRRQFRPDLQAAAGCSSGSQVLWTYMSSASGTGSPTSETESSSNHFNTPDGSVPAPLGDGYGESLRTDDRQELDGTTESIYPQSHLLDTTHRDLLIPTLSNDATPHHPLPFAQDNILTHHNPNTLDFSTDLSATRMYEIFQSLNTIDYGGEGE